MLRRFVLFTLLILVTAMVLGSSASAGAGNPRTTTVMSINIYQGTELEHVLAATDLPSLVAAVTLDYGNVRATNFALRAQALAGEIATAQPTLVGLQEVATWTVNGTVSYDFLQILLNALAARGMHYTPVITRENWSATAPGVIDGAVKLVSLAEGTALLARTDLPTDELKWSNPQSHDFTARTVFPFLGQPFDLGGGWLSVDAKVRGKSFRFVTTHMDPISSLARTAQAAQILADAGADGLPLVIAGDTNSDPTSTAYHEFIDSGLTDTWATLHPDEQGFTCCHIKIGQPDADAINDPNAPLTEPVDYVLTSPGITPLSETLFNTTPTEMSGGLWPTDHAAIAATLGLDSQLDDGVTPIPAASGIAAATRTTTFPPQLVGTWTRTVSKADVTREEAFPTLAESVCTLTIQESGSAHIACPHTPGLDFTGKIVPKRTNRVQIVFADLNPNTYTWRVSGRRLILTKLKDPTPDRAATMSGVWKRK